VVVFDLGETRITYTIDFGEREKNISEEVHNLVYKMENSESDRFLEKSQER